MKSKPKPKTKVKPITKPKELPMPPFNKSLDGSPKLLTKAKAKDRNGYV